MLEMYLCACPQWKKEVIMQRVYVYEHQGMECFIETKRSASKRSNLTKSIQGSGAFRRFKDTCFDVGLENSWNTYRDKQMVIFIKDWCEENHIPYQKGDKHEYN